MTETPAISVVLPTYNGSRYIDEAIRSCINQTYPNWELIIVDDASTDNTPARISQYVARDNRIQSIRHETNRKLPAALNTGFSQANGDYLTWTSDDNYYLPNAFQAFVEFLNGNPEIDVAYSDYDQIDENGSFLQTVCVDDPERLIFGNCVGASFMYRRRVQEKLGSFNTSLFLAEDYDYWLRAMTYFSFKATHKVLYRYRLHDASLRTRRSDDIYRAHVQALATNAHNLTFLPRKQIAEAFLLLAFMFHNRSILNLSRKCFFYALRCDPLYAVAQIPRGVLLDIVLGNKIGHVLRKLVSSFS